MCVGGGGGGAPKWGNRGYDTMKLVVPTPPPPHARLQVFVPTPFKG